MALLALAAENVLMKCFMIFGASLLHVVIPIYNTASLETAISWSLHNMCWHNDWGFWGICRGRDTSHAFREPECYASKIQFHFDNFFHLNSANTYTFFHDSHQDHWRLVGFSSSSQWWCQCHQEEQSYLQGPRSPGSELHHSDKGCCCVGDLHQTKETLHWTKVKRRK